MKRLVIIFLAILAILPVYSTKKADKETLTWRYEVQDLGKVAKDGKSVIFKIWSFGKKENKVILQAGKNAVHAVIFKQIGNEPPLAGTESVEVEHKEFFKAFFADGGEYMRFVQFANHGAIEAGDKIKIGNEYKIGVRVTVNKADLEKYLKEKGILISMDSLF